MHFTTESFQKRSEADLLVLPFWSGKKSAEPAAEFSSLKGEIAAAVKSKDFLGKEGEVTLLYSTKQPEPRIALLGLGEREKVTKEKLRRAYASLVKGCRKQKVKALNLAVPDVESMSKGEVIQGVSEGLLLANYAFERLKTQLPEEDRAVFISKVALLGQDAKALAIAKKHATIAEGVYFVRNLVNGNADEITPQRLGQIAQEIAKGNPKLKATVFDKKRIIKEKMGLLLAVNRGSNLDPAFIILEYAGDPKSKDRTVLVGKGVTYDTGGLSLKPVHPPGASTMGAMKCDMAGAAIVLGAVQTAARLGLKVNLTAVVPTTENSIGSRSYKPGDVYVGYDGKSVEVVDPDAEGRLILADALAYAVRNLKPSRIIDLATLTGSIEIALGNEAAGLFSNDDALADALLHAGTETYERLWRMPMFEEYRDQIKSEIADIKNVGGRPAGATTAAYFLKEFVGDTPWAHCDIAAVSFLGEARRYHPKHGSGIGLRLLIAFLEHRIEA